MDQEEQGGETQVEASDATEFLVRSNAYDSTAIAQALGDLENEITDEKELAASLGDPNQIREDAKKFKANNALLVRSQATRLRELQKELTDHVLRNNTLLAENEEVVALLQNPEYRAISRDLADIDASISASTEFLAAHGRAGRRKPKHVSLTGLS